MQTRLIINGAHGKMGQITTEFLKKYPQYEIVGELGRNDDLGKEILKNKAEIVIDFTHAECVFRNALTIIGHNAHPIIGATGLSQEEIKTLSDLCLKKKLGGLIVPNFSVASVLMMHFAKIAAHYLPDVEIVEAHHPQKKDAPSGTAI